MRTPTTGDDTLAVDVRGLRVVYGGFTAVHGIDLQVRQGELLALLGTNGAGKTSTLETLGGHRRPSAGDVRVLGKDPYRERRHLAGEVSAMLQQAGLADELTVTETLRMWQKLHAGRSGPADPLAVVDLDRHRDIQVKRLSGGERRRLDLALAISTGPSLLFLDEPTTGLDPASRERAWNVLRDLLDEGRSILLTTHYLEEAEALADRVAIMSGGTVVVSGTQAEVIAGYPARIRCVLPGGAGRELPRLTGRPTVLGDELNVLTHEPQADLDRLLDWARRQRVALGRLRVTEASLAEVFAAISRQEETR
ncbi:ABC transporter ATP-binding protein [Nonomuraea sp. NPDC050547]|uniref:ABC transporter ATP-binding protein n=1 Tax=Nonomuraea sp. NPDC050547 TaxID=3364368 RepID=UPI0037B04108